MMVSLNPSQCEGGVLWFQSGAEDHTGSVNSVFTHELHVPVNASDWNTEEPLQAAESEWTFLGEIHEYQWSIDIN